MLQSAKTGPSIVKALMEYPTLKKVTPPCTSISSWEKKNLSHHSNLKAINHNPVLPLSFKNNPKKRTITLNVLKNQRVSSKFLRRLK